MGSFLPVPFLPAIGQLGIFSPGAKLKFFITETSTPTNVYADADLGVSLGDTVTADAFGRFVDIFLDDTITYRIRLETALGALIDEVDPFTTPANTSNMLRLDLAADDGSSLIGFIASPFGAVARTQLSKDRDTVSVLDFGADPTGVADSTAAFNLATGAAQVHTGNDTVLKRAILVPGGTYKIDGTVYVRRGQQLIGDGWGSSFIDLSTATGTSFLIGAGDSGTVDPGGLGVIVSNLFFFGGFPTEPVVDATLPDSWGVIDCMFTEAGIGVRVGGTDGIVSRNIFDGGLTAIEVMEGHSHRIEGNLFFNTTNDIRVFSDAADVIISGNFSQFAERTCLELVAGATGIRNIAFVNNTCLLNVQYGTNIGFVFINATGADLQIDACRFYNGRSVAIAYGGGLGNKITVTNCIFDGLKTVAAYAQSTNAGGLEVSNMDVTINDCIFRNLTGHTVFCGPTSSTIVRLSGNTFSGNTFSTSEIVISGVSASSAIFVDPSNISDRAILPSQTGVPAFANEISRGQATLVAGSSVVVEALTQATSRVRVNRFTDGGTVGASYSITRNPGVGFTIQSKDGAGANQAADTSVVDWVIDLAG